MFYTLFRIKTSYALLLSFDIWARVIELVLLQKPGNLG